MVAPLVEIDEQAVMGAVAGDADALASVLRAYGPSLHRHFAERIGRRYQAMLSSDDVLQVTFMEAFLHIRSFTYTGKNSFFAWLRQIGENNLRDAIRELDAKKRPERGRLGIRSSDDFYSSFLGELVGSLTTPTQHARRVDTKTLLEAALERLPPDYATVVRLYDLEERHIDEVVAAFDPPRSRGAIHMLRLRAFDCLRRLLAESGTF